MPDPECPRYLLRSCDRCGMKHYVSDGYKNDYVNEDGESAIVAGYCIARG